MKATGTLMRREYYERSTHYSQQYKGSCFNTKTVLVHALALTNFNKLSNPGVHHGT